ncbi:MAG: hypothetical protein JO152_12520 [Mycobacteriaceae bacterium]|nr:hypothetical protein [Mycobacteriaceae bacterium]
MPSTGPVVSRRQALLGAAALTLLATACGSEIPQAQVDDLEAQRDMAQKDSELAAAAAKAADPTYVPALNVVAADRAAHAKALSAEISRVARTKTSASVTSTSVPSTATPAPAPPPPSVADITAALRNSADSAGQLATKVSGYRAGLLGSIVAYCNATIAVPLAARKPAS